MSRILIDYDGTVSVKGKIDIKKINLIKQAMVDGHAVKIYTSRKGEAVHHLKHLLYKRFGLKIRAMGGRENYDLFVELKAGNWNDMEEFLRRHKRRKR